MTDESSAAKAALQATDPLDALSAAPHHHEVLLENDSVRVLDTRLAPGERTPVHTHRWPAALYVLGWSDFIRYDPDGKVLLDSRSLAAKPLIGASLWSAPLAPHYVHNVGSGELRVVAIELKRS